MQSRMNVHTEVDDGYMVVDDVGDIGVGIDVGNVEAGVQIGVHLHTIAGGLVANDLVDVDVSVGILEYLVGNVLAGDFEEVVDSTDYLKIVV